MIPGDIVTITRTISNAANAKTEFESFGKRGGVFITRKRPSNWEVNRIVYVVIDPDGTIANGNIFRWRSNSITPISQNASDYGAAASADDEYYFVGDAP